ADEDVAAAAARELEEEAGVRGVCREQGRAVGTRGRDPRGHAVTVLWVGLVEGGKHPLAPGGDAAAARWFDAAGPGPLPPLAFDHAELLRLALEHLRRR